jgi:hypothetical protein
MDSTDHDGDGFSWSDGDCNDCDPDINPGAFDVPGDGIDEDCDGIPDDEPTGCDATVALASSDPFDAARAIDLCRQTTADAVGPARTWGVIDAAFVAPDGTDQCVPFGGPADGGTSCSENPEFALGYGNLSKLGVNSPRVGAHMLGLSSGTARDPTDPGYVTELDKQYTDGAAAGFPAPSPACPGLMTGQPHDGVALALTIRVPTNAKSFSLSENFFTHEYPAFICSMYDDAFVIEMTPPPTSGPTSGNIAFDSAGNPICVNNSLLQVCEPQTVGGKTFACPLGPSSLEGTGFGAEADSSAEGVNHAATGWLQTNVALEGSRGATVTFFFALWDSTDGDYDSTALVDGFTWSIESATTNPITQPAITPQ